jgi:hypothetical protein
MHRQSQESEATLELHPKQRLAFHSKATEIGYGGAAGGGKSYLLRAVAIAACTEIPGIKVYLFRKHFEELIQNHVDATAGFREVLAPWIDKGAVKILETEIRFINGSKIYLCHCSHNKHLDKYLGPEMHLLLIDQAEQFPERWLRYLRHRVRMSIEQKERVPEHLRGIYPRIIYSFNPGGISHSYFRKQFVKSRGPLECWKTPDSEGGFTRQFIPAYLADNPSLDEAEYRGALMGLNDEQLVRALLEGDFDALVGNYFPEYEEARHVVPDFSPPSHWFKFRTFDWGSAEPFACYWWAVSDGEPFTDGKGVNRWFPRGALVAYREWYGCHPNKSAEGLRLRNEDVARGIIARTHEQTSGLTITDSLPFQDRGMSRSGRKYTIADVFFEEGCPLTQGNTARIHGWSQLRDRLIGEEGLPLIFFTESCVYARDYLPALERNDKNPEDAVDKGEATHAADCIRLACTARPITRDIPRGVSEPVFDRTITPSKILKRIQKKKTSFGRT